MNIEVFDKADFEDKIVVIMLDKDAHRSDDYRMRELYKVLQEKLKVNQILVLPNGDQIRVLSKEQVVRLGDDFVKELEKL